MIKKILLIILLFILAGCHYDNSPTVQIAEIQYEEFKLEDWDKYPQQANELYNSILNKSYYICLYGFNSLEDAREFWQKFDNLYGLNGWIAYNKENNPIVYKLICYEYNYKELYSNIDVMDKIEKITQSLVNEEMTQVEAIMTISQWIVDNHEYLLGQNDLYKFIESGKGNCAAYAALFRQMCRAAGIENDIVVGRVINGWHAWNRVKINDEWYYCDLTGADGIITLNKYYILSKKLWITYTFERLYNGLCY